MDARGLGWIPDVPKVEDYTGEHEEVMALLTKTKLPKLKAAKAGAPSAPPAQVDLRTGVGLSPVEDQGQIGSCTANAAVAMLEYFERKSFNTFVDASRLFLYKAERDLLGWTGDTGALLRTAMEALVLFGAPPERYWPYDGRPAAANTHYDLEPSAFLYAFGANFQATRYFRHDPAGATTAQTLNNIKTYLAGGFPSIFGFPVYPEYDHPLAGGLVAYPAAGGHSRGGHANCAVGYDDTKMIGADQGALLIRNSWGTTWANAGYAWMSYKYVTQGLAKDWWSMISARWVDTGAFA